MNKNQAPHEIRRCKIFKNKKLVLEIEDVPGKLHSSASPPSSATPPSPPNQAATDRHPFLSGFAYDAVSEHELLKLLEVSPNFDTYLINLTNAGFDVIDIRGRS